MARAKKTPIWKYRHRQDGTLHESKLEAYWEVELDPLSDKYTPRVINAHDLFCEWKEKILKEFSNGLIPIHWFVINEEEEIFEGMPFQFEHLHSESIFTDDNFLTTFTWPVNKDTREHLNWLTLPVVDKLWKHERADKGGFLQQYTGWKPSIFQPYLYIPTFSRTIG